MDWRDALSNIRAKGYRQTKNGRYEAYVSNHSKTVMLGTHDTADDAKNAVYSYREDRLKSGVDRYGLNIDEGVVYQNEYLVFRNGMIFNLHGEPIRGGIGRGGYRHGIVGRRNRDFHKIIADCFIDNPNNLRDINHKDGNKLNLDVNNLERTSHSDNVIHAYKTGLTKPQLGEDHHNSKLTINDVKYIRSSEDSSYQLANKFGVDSSTIRDIRRRKTWRSVE